MAGFDDVVSMLGGSAGAPAPAASKYGTPPDILDRLQQTESSGNPYAVNKQTGAMGPYQFMPQTVAMLHQQGYKFDPFDQQQARDAADFYIQQLKQKNGGDINKALASYGGFVTKDPTNYVSKVAGTNPRFTAPSPAPNAPGAFDDVVGLLQHGPAPAPVASNKPAPAVDGPHQFTPAQEREGEHEVAANVITGMGASIYGGLKGLATTGMALLHGDGISSAMDQGANAVKDAQDHYTYEPKTAAGADKLAGFNSAYNPLSWPGRVGNFLGEKTADVTGSPGLGAAVNAGVQVLGPAAAAKGLRALPGIATPEAAPPRVEPTLEGAPSAPPQPAQIAAPPNAPQVERPAPQGPSSVVPAAPEGSLELSPAQQAQRAQVLSQIGLSDVRRSALTGDQKAAATDWQTQKLDGPAGNYLKGKFDEERNALQAYGDNIVRSTGGTPGLAEDDLYSRGQTILAPLDQLRQWYDNQTKALYQEADSRAQGVPTSLDSFRSVLGDDSLMTNSDRVHLRDAVAAYAKKLGISADENGVFANGQQAETLRKYLNENWSPQNSGYISALKDALDDDVFQAAGEDVYGQARAMRAQRAATLDNPSGIAKLVDADGINRAVKVEGIPNAIVSMPVDQLGHVVETLRNAPPEVQPAAQKALSEIKAQFANKLNAIGRSQQGQWNSKGVSDYLDANRARMAQVFTPEELQKFDTLRQAGEILRTPQSYPGAAVQKANILRTGAGAALQHGTTAAGGVAGSLLGPLGAAAGSTVGQAIGDRMATALGERGALKAAQRRTVPISDFLNLGDGK
jgi:hypothetical protein